MGIPIHMLFYGIALEFNVSRFTALVAEIGDEEPERREGSRCNRLKGRVVL